MSAPPDQKLLSRSALAIVAALFYMLPVADFLASGRSLFLMFWEFGAYRYYSALSVLAGEPQSTWVVQGFPMAILQLLILKVLTLAAPEAVGSVSQIDLFCKLTLWLGYLLGGAALAGVWLWTRASFLAKGVLTVATLAMWPMTRHHAYLYAPDYWIFEVPFYVVTTGWTLHVLESDDTQPPSIGATMWAACWVALAFLQKPSLAGFAALPFALRTSSARGRPWKTASRVGLFAIVFVVAHAAIFWSLLLFRADVLTAKLAAYWRWLALYSETGTTLVPLGTLVRSHDALFAPIAFGLVVSAGAVCTRLIAGGRDRKHWRLILFLALLTVGHLAVIWKRPSGTSVIDFLFFSSAAAVLSLTLTPPRLKNGLVLAAMVGALGFVALRPAFLWTDWHSRPGEPEIHVIEEMRDYVRSLGRPVLVVLPDNRLHPLTAEAFGLFSGQLMLRREEVGPDGLPKPLPASSLRERLFPSSFIAMRSIAGGFSEDEDDLVRASIDAGFVVTWGALPGMPPAEHFYPSLRRMREEPSAVIREFSLRLINGGVTTIAYLSDRRPPPALLPTRKGRRQQLNLS